MNLKAWETTIQQIVSELSCESRESAKLKVITAWRGKLEQEPTSLLPFQIDEIVRAVRGRLAAS